AAARVGSVENAVLEYGNRGTLGSFHRVIVDDVPQDRTGSLVRVRIDAMDDRGILHAHVVPSDPNALAAGDDELAGKGGRS
ncbi:MAG: hypothetical protein ACLT5H_09495, partial [Collinsella stercoris]